LEVVVGDDVPIKDLAEFLLETVVPKHPYLEKLASSMIGSQMMIGSRMFFFLVFFSRGDANQL
jgi:hypothetical protein